MKLLVSILFICFCANMAQSQTDSLLNKRYNINNYNATIFSTVAVTDSGYYLTALGTNTNNLIDEEYLMARIGFDGNVIVFNTHSDTNNFYISNFTDQGTPSLIKTLDGYFAQVLFTETINNIRSFIFIKTDYNGNIIAKTYLNDFTVDLNFNSYYPAQLLQNEDSTYIGAAVITTKTPPYKDAYVIYKLNKNGNMLWHKTHWIDIYYPVSFPSSILKYSNNKYIIGGYKGLYDYSNLSAHRMYPHFIVTDSLGNFLYDHTGWNDHLIFETKSLTKTINGNILYCGKYGQYYDMGNYDKEGYFSSITKMDTNFNVIWRINIGIEGATFTVGFNKLIQVNDTEYVAVGYNVDSLVLPYGNLCGYLVKFNLSGEVLWERRYVKILPFDNNYYPYHYLYDIDITRDSGFVMVGQVQNNHNYSGYLPGVKGWVVKTDKHGCLVPGCEIYDNIGVIPIDTTTFVIDTNNTDTTHTDTTTQTIPPPNVLYPNPATTELYYYHTQDSSASSFNVFIYNLQGQVVQQFTVTGNNITYIIDISQLASAVYIFKVISDNGEVVVSERFVKVGG